LRILILTFVLIIVNWFTTIPLILKVDEKGIGNNIRDLKKRQWFKTYWIIRSIES